MSTATSEASNARPRDTVRVEVHLLLQLGDYPGAGHANVVSGLVAPIRLGLEFSEQHLPLAQGNRKRLARKKGRNETQTPACGMATSTGAHALRVEVFFSFQTGSSTQDVLRKTLQTGGGTRMTFTPLIAWLGWVGVYLRPSTASRAPRLGFTLLFSHFSESVKLRWLGW